MGGKQIKRQMCYVATSTPKDEAKPQVPQTCTNKMKHFKKIRFEKVMFPLRKASYHVGREPW